MREVVGLGVSDMDVQRDMLRGEQGQGRKERYTLLGPRLLAELRPYWRVYRPPRPWLFPQRTKAVALAISTAQQM